MEEEYDDCSAMVVSAGFTSFSIRQNICRLQAVPYGMCNLLQNANS